MLELIDITMVTKNKKVLKQLQTNDLTVVATGKNTFYFEKCKSDFAHGYLSKLLRKKENLFDYIIK